MATAGSDGPDFPVRVECTASALVAHIIPVRPESPLQWVCVSPDQGADRRNWEKTANIWETSAVRGIAVRKFDQLRFRRVLLWSSDRALAGRVAGVQESVSF